MFGSVVTRKNELLRRLDWLDKQRSFHDDARLEEEYWYTWREYETTLAQEEIFWFQKSRTRWLQYGDRNTKYFHGVTTIRRRKNRYDMLQDANGTWLRDSNQLEQLVTGYYKDLFKDDDLFTSYLLTGAFPPIDEEEKQSLKRWVTREEIYQTVK